MVKPGMPTFWSSQNSSARRQVGPFYTGHPTGTHFRSQETTSQCTLLPLTPLYMTWDCYSSSTFALEGINPLFEVHMHMQESPRGFWYVEILQELADSSPYLRVFRTRI